mmetsp:Transcript_45346/g.128267  ORF Transcript_45346/g.128267 Transcript_45346/m.128267 type:complete len:207 (-) Transcript_45346:394-1014(-)
MALCARLARSSRRWCTAGSNWAGQMRSPSSFPFSKASVRLLSPVRSLPVASRPSLYFWSRMSSSRYSILGRISILRPSPSSTSSSATRHSRPAMYSSTRIWSSCSNPFARAAVTASSVPALTRLRPMELSSRLGFTMKGMLCVFRRRFAVASRSTPCTSFLRSSPFGTGTPATAHTAFVRNLSWPMEHASGEQPRTSMPSMSQRAL